MARRWYEHWLSKASRAERDGKLKQAVAALDKAEKHTFDPDELKYLNLWRDRLRGEVVKLFNKWDACGGRRGSDYVG